MTDDPSTNSDEWVWRCKYAASGFACSSVLDRHSILCGLTLATPSPVLDSERPASARLTRDQVCEALQSAWNDYCTDSGDHPADFEMRGGLLYMQAGIGNWTTWVTDRLNATLADAHRCPTPERDDAAIRFYIDRDVEPGTLCDHLCGEDSSGRYVLAAIPRDVADELMRQLDAATPERDDLAGRRAASRPDSIQFRLRQFTPHHPLAPGRKAMMDAADLIDDLDRIASDRRYSDGFVGSSTRRLLASHPGGE